jgi:hypothetical protein
LNFYLSNALLALFSENALIIKEKSNFLARSQLILSVAKPFKPSCPVVLNLFQHTLKSVHLNAGKLTKICTAMVILGNTPESPSSNISSNNSFSLQSNLKFTDCVLRKMVSPPRHFEI